MKDEFVPTPIRIGGIRLRFGLFSGGKLLCTGILDGAIRASKSFFQVVILHFFDKSSEI
ncbi:hypothetical protein VIM7927_03181 [Vibrio mangrovi]|uniref:Uncharacterized protein n=1 Tax=Vibrio mangrovi TaxID=474394 RepID=A0A1Y6IZG1_9VIBR|nr:hypothetical protein VIM7927_03181 [Vibrio mangrovi]